MFYLVQKRDPIPYISQLISDGSFMMPNCNSALSKYVPKLPLPTEEFPLIFQENSV